MSYKVLTIAQHKGGSGKTTIAANLAVTFSKQGKRVTVIDIDPQENFSKWYKLRKEKYSDKTNINCKTISGWHLHEEISSIKDKTDIFIIDTPPSTEADTKIAIKISDLVLIPVQLSLFDIWSTQNTLEAVNAERIPHRILLNRVMQNTNLNKLIPESFTKPLNSMIYNSVQFASTIADGLTISESLPNINAAHEIEYLRQELHDLLFPIIASEKAA